MALSFYLYCSLSFKWSLMKLQKNRIYTYSCILLIYCLILLWSQNELVELRGRSEETDNRRIEDFDVESYLAVTRVKQGDDAYANNAYNQEASDKAPFDRDVPDVRASQ